MKAVKRKESNTAWTKNPCYLQVVQGHSAIQGPSGGIPINPEMMGHTLIPYNWKECIFHRAISWNFQSLLGSGLIPGEKQRDRARQTVFFTPLNPFGNDPDEDALMVVTVPQKVPYKNRRKRNQDAACWIKLKRAQDQGLQFLQTK